MLFIFILSLLQFTHAANDNSLLLPAELIDTIAEDFKLKKKPEVVFTRKPLTVFIQTNEIVHPIVFDGDNTVVDFANYGAKTKFIKISLDKAWVPAPKEPEPETPKEEVHAESKEGEGHAAAIKEEPPAHGEAAGHSEAPGHGEAAKPAEGHGEEKAKAATGHDVKEVVGPQTLLYFINRYREEKVSGHTFGIPCGKALKIQSHVDDLFTPQGIKVVTAEGRHLDLFGGDFVLVHLDGEEFNAAFFRFKDTRYANRLCKMSFE